MTEQALTGYPSIDKPWLKYYSEEAINAPLPEGTIYNFLTSRNKERMDAIALNYFGRKTTYRKLIEQINRTSSALVASGVNQGDVVSICMPNMPETVIAFYAVNKLGAIACMINPLNSGNEIENELREQKSKILFIVSACLPKVKNLSLCTDLEKVVIVSPADSMPLPLRTVFRLGKERHIHIPSDRCVRWSRFLKEGKSSTTETGGSHSPAVILHTGGTTGEPKGVLFSNQSFNSLVCEEEFPSRYDENYCSSEGDVLWPIVPMFYGYGLCVGVHVTLCYGMTVLLIPQPDVNKIFETVKKCRPNHIFGIPSYLEAMIADRRFEGMDLSFFKYIVTGGDSMSVESENRINEFLKEHGAKVKLVKGYGMTELIATATLTLPNCNEIGSVGVPMSMTNVKIVEPSTERELKYRETGEICFSSPTMMKGYCNKPSATDEIVKIHQDGVRWIHTGDLGYVTEDGSVFHRGRLKRIMVTYFGPEHTPQKLFPDRVESILSAHEAVALAAVVGVPHAEFVNVAKAYIVLKRDITPSAELRKEIKEYCQNKLPAFSVPYQYEFTKELPRTKVGKVDYRALESRN